MQPVADARLESEARAAAAAAPKPATKTTKVEPGRKRITPKKPTTPSAKDKATAKKLLGSIGKKDPFAQLKPRDEKVWKKFPNAIKRPCPTCGAKAGTYCRDKKSLRTPHAKRREA